MPELPEVETVRRTLAPAVGADITRVWTSGLPLRLNRPVPARKLARLCKGARIGALRRLGKYLLIDLADRQEAVLVHLGMSGRLRLTAATEPRAPHTHVIVGLADGRELRFSDPRRFGMFEVAPGAGHEREHPSLAILGRDPLTDPPTGAFLFSFTQKSRQTIKTLLLDQRILAGMGNIYVSEALWRARIHPARRAFELDRPEVGRLARAVPRVLEDALERGGTSLRDFVDADGAAGENADYLQVYGRGGHICPRRGCTGTLQRTVIQGRATFHCPNCQA